MEIMRIRSMLLMVEVRFLETMEYLKDLLKGVMNKDFKVELSSDLDYEEMVVYVSWNEIPLVVLSCEEGFNKIKIEFDLDSDNKNPPMIPLDDFLDALEFGKKILVQSIKTK